jgi:hypothetical protein
VRFSFRALPVGHYTVRPRPIVDVVVGGFRHCPPSVLLDGGATTVRFGGHVAELCGLDLSGAPTAWSAPVWFCEPWMPAFGLLGLTGFFDQFEVTIASYEERIELAPVTP